MILVHGAEISCAEPSVLGEGSLGGLFILIVSAEHAYAPDEDFARHVLRISGVYLQIDDFVGIFSTLLKFVAALVAKTYSRRCFGHTVSGNERKLELLHEKLLQMLRNGGTAGNEQPYVASECLHENGGEGFTEVGVVLVVGKFGCAALAVDEFSYRVLEQFYKNQRNREEYIRPKLPQSRFQIGRDRRQSKHDEVHSVA